MAREQADGQGECWLLAHEERGRSVELQLEQARSVAEHSTDFSAYSFPP